jgi:DNA helicase-2/ATP-dependent DNA helicase PcrA
VPPAPLDTDTAERLRAWRSERARDDGVPAYVVLTNACLDEVCRRLPGDEDELLEIPGLGPTRIERYGRDLLEVLRAAPGAGASMPPLPV